MTSDIDELKKLFTAKPRPTSWAERRERMDEICAVDPPPADIAFTPFEIGSVPAEWSLAPGSDQAKVLLYFHGGGYCAGSIASHRGMVGTIGKLAGIRTLAIACRLAPEHPIQPRWRTRSPLGASFAPRATRRRPSPSAATALAAT